MLSPRAPVLSVTVDLNLLTVNVYFEAGPRIHDIVFNNIVNISSRNVDLAINVIDLQILEYAAIPGVGVTVGPLCPSLCPWLEWGPG